ncbi:hypothetical protein GCM10028811_25760 [Uliginosibacterium sediminicola]
MLGEGLGTEVDVERNAYSNDDADQQADGNADKGIAALKGARLGVNSHARVSGNWLRESITVGVLQMRAVRLRTASV